MTDEDLIQQLRNSKGWPTLGNAAADRIEALIAECDRLARLVEEAKGALEKIERWEDFPATGEFWPSGKPVSYTAQYGSNGARDFMRAIARATLANMEKTDD